MVKIFEGSRITPPPTTAFEIKNVRIIPCIERVACKNVDIHSKLTNKIKIDVPFIPSPMDSVMNYEMSTKTIQFGSVPILYVNSTKVQECHQILKGLRKKYNMDINIGICIPPDIDFIDSIKDILQMVNIVALDTLHSMPYYHLKAIEYFKKKYFNLDLISGNITNVNDLASVADCGVDAIRIGMTSNSVNLGSEIIGCGRKQGIAIFECAIAAEKYNIPIIADGGVSHPMDIALAIALGADCVMIGKMFAAMYESPCEVVEIKNKKYKYYRGMSRKDIIDEDMIVESSPKLIEISGDYETEVSNWIKILKAAIARSGQDNIEGLRKKSLLELI